MYSSTKLRKGGQGPFSSPTVGGLKRYKRPNSRSPNRKKVNTTTTSSSRGQSTRHTTGGNNTTIIASSTVIQPPTPHKETLSGKRSKSRIQLKLEEQERLAKSHFGQTVNYLSRKTHFEPDQVRALLEIFRKLSGGGSSGRGKHGGGTMNRLRFREMLHNTLGLTDDLMLDRIFASFDGDNEGSVSESEWVLGLSVILKGTLDEQIAYCYEVYDVNSDQAIGREELTSCLRGCLHLIPGGDEEGPDLEEGGREIVELAMKKLDLDRDGCIKFKDFRDAVHEDPLLLQAIGECLPRDKAMMTFLALFDTEPRDYSTFLSHPLDPAWERENNKWDPVRAEEIRKKFLKISFESRSSSSSNQLKSIFKSSEASVSNNKHRGAGG